MSSEGKSLYFYPKLTPKTPYEENIFSKLFVYWVSKKCPYFIGNPQPNVMQGKGFTGRGRRIVAMCPCLIWQQHQLQYARTCLEPKQISICIRTGAIRSKYIFL